MQSSTSLSTGPGTDDESSVFDVRPIPCRVKHGLIFQRWLDLAVGQHFVLLNDHDPVPLYYQFSAEFPDAFTWEYVQRGPEEFRVKITKLRAVDGGTPEAPAATRECPGHDNVPEPARNSEDLDVRGLEPPEPLIRILDRLETLPDHLTLRARTDREPCHLFGEAEQRGFRHASSVLPDGSWVTVLSRG